MHILFLLQGDRHHPNDALAVIALEALTGVNYLTGKPLWSPSIVGWDGRQMDDM